MKGYRVIQAANGEEALEKIPQEKPDLLILDVNMNGLSGYQICEKIRKDSQFMNLPVILLTVDNTEKSQIMGFSCGANDYITKPFISDILLARVSSLIRRNLQAVDSNPLSGLPGNTSIFLEIERKIAASDPFAVVMADLDNFKSFNDAYGFYRGDQVIKLIANILVNTFKQIYPENYFVGHIGGDDFLGLCASKGVEQLCRRVVFNFDTMIPHYYDDDDLKNGYLMGKNRKGVETKFPIVSVSLAAVTSEGTKFNHVGEISTALAELKKFVKELPGSNYLVDRRKTETASLAQP